MHNKEMHQLLLIALTTVALTAHAAPSTKPRIMIDPGHGGTDTGASLNGAKESEIALLVSKRLKEVLVERGYHVTLTREKDESLALEERAAKANQIKPDLFLSIHLNSSNDSKAQGKEFYFQNQLQADEESMFLANRENADLHDSINDRTERSGVRRAESEQIPALSIEPSGTRNDVRRILEDLARNDRVKRSSLAAIEMDRAWSESPFAARFNARNSSRTIRQAPFFLVTHVAAPSVLVEVGFLSHKREGARLQTDEYQNALALSLAGGIDRYFQSVK
ncbi:MAG: N-acetylmuramoyl-L-alanine amidase [Bdellovibrionaceae bacterium]|nr:N-acetylmuramoyl-L-alanine amidase [Pseudobdellovibrionaceae bacterium]